MTAATLDVRGVRRLALARAGLLPKRWSGLPDRASGSGARAFKGALEVIDRFGYLQLDSVSIVGARSHGLVLLSRLEGFAPELAEQLLQPDRPLFEYWGHEASWLPLDLYPAMAFRRSEFRVHPWWGDLLGEHRGLADDILRRLDQEGPLRTSSFEGADHAAWWGYRSSKKVLAALWSAGDVAIAERRGFQRLFDLTERVIPEHHRSQDLDAADGHDVLILRSLDGHGWATAATLAATFRLPAADARSALHRLVEKGEVVDCDLVLEDRRLRGFIRPQHLELAAQLQSIRPRRDRGVLLSPFDPLLWDRKRVQLLFGFEQMLEIYKPKEKRVYGYYCLPILAGEQLIGRVDLKANRRPSPSESSRDSSGDKKTSLGRLEVLSLHFESAKPASHHRQAADQALRRLATSLGLDLSL